MKKVVITGANGFVGSSVVKELIKHKIKIYAVDLQECDENLPKNELVEFIGCDLDNIGDLERELEGKEVDTFYHFAWAGSSGESRANTSLQLRNAQWTIDALKVAKNIGCQRFVCAGSIMEYETIAATYELGNKPGLGYIYGSGKLVAHAMAKAVAAQIGIDLIWAEITNAYGVGEKSPRLINSTIRKIIKGEKIEFTSGTQNYDFVYIDDVAKAFYLIGKNGKGFHEYLIGSSTARPLKEFLIEMKNAIAPDVEFNFGNVPFTGTDLPLEKFDCSHTEKDTGFRAEISFAEGVRKTTNWLKEN